jgi:hypothetical protein
MVKVTSFRGFGRRHLHISAPRPRVLVTLSFGRVDGIWSATLTVYLTHRIFTHKFETWGER